MTPARSLRVLVAPDSFKGSLTSVEVARALAAGWQCARPTDEMLLAPLADGGEGTLVAIEAAGDWEWQTADVHDPLGRPIRARWLRSSDGRQAVVEMAQASGLSLVPAEERDPLAATSVGTGELLLAAIRAGARSVVLGIGGSATTDGGTGLLRGLGARPAARAGVAQGRGAGDGGNRHWDLSALDALSDVDLAVASDVTNPLLGPRGAAAVYGPQKGATAEQVAELDGTLAAWADRLERATGRRERDTPGAGAAGGVGFALLAIQDRFGSFALRPGVDVVMEATGFATKLESADVVLTGEGRIDDQTAYGKTALGVARRAAGARRPCIAFGGGVTVEGIQALATVGTVVVPVVERPVSLEEAIAAGAAPIERAAERAARLLDLAAALG